VEHTLEEGNLEEDTLVDIPEQGIQAVDKHPLDTLQIHYTKLKIINSKTP
jgi:hypothetical protein